MNDSMDNDARERARKRLQARTARLRESGAADAHARFPRVSLDDSGDAAPARRAATRQNRVAGGTSASSYVPEDAADYPDTASATQDPYRGRHAAPSPETPRRSYRTPEQEAGFADEDAYEQFEDQYGDEFEYDTPVASDGFGLDAVKEKGTKLAGAAANGAKNLVGAARERLGARGFVIACALVVIALIAVVGIVQCASTPAEIEHTVVETPSEDEEPEPIDTSGIDEEELDAILGTDTAKKLVQEAQTNADAAWIASNPQDYAMDGERVQMRLLTLAADEPEALPFVRAFPSKYPQETGASTDDAPQKGTVPAYYTWDERWGYTVYSSTTFALTGMGPTAMSMVYQGLTGASDGTPYDMGVLANQLGYMGEFSGTDAGFMLYGVSDLGLTCETIEIDADALKARLDKGQFVIANVGAGDFTDSSSYIVLSGVTDEGKLTIHDPYSAVKSSQKWDIEDILNQTWSLYAYTASGTSTDADVSDETTDTPSSEEQAA